MVAVPNCAKQQFERFRVSEKTETLQPVICAL